MPKRITIKFILPINFTQQIELNHFTKKTLKFSVAHICNLVNIIDEAIFLDFVNADVDWTILFVISHSNDKSNDFIIVIIVKSKCDLEFFIDFLLKITLAKHIFEIFIIELIRRIFSHIKVAVGVIIARSIDNHFAIVLYQAWIVIRPGENGAHQALVLNDKAKITHRLEKKFKRISWSEWQNRNMIKIAKGRIFLKANDFVKAGKDKFKSAAESLAQFTQNINGAIVGIFNGSQKFIAFIKQEH